MVDIEKLREVLTKATRGPWERRGYSVYANLQFDQNSTGDRIASCAASAGASAEDNADAIVALRFLVPTLIDELERKTKALEWIATAQVAFNAHPVGVIETMRERAKAALKGTPND